jgi:hypothetical protein
MSDASFSCSQSLPTDEDDRRAISRCQREDLREVSIQGDSHARFAGSVVENLSVRRLVHRDFPDVRDVPALVSQNRSCGRRQPLIKDDALHAASI